MWPRDADRRASQANALDILPILPKSLASMLYSVGALVVATAIFVVDTLVPDGLAIAVLYALVVILGSAFLDRRGLLAVSGICVIFTLVGFLSDHGTTLETDAVIRCAVSLCAIGITTALALKNQTSTLRMRNQAALLDLSHDAIFVRDRNDIIIFWNSGAEDLYGWSAAEAIGRQAAELLDTHFPVPRPEIDSCLTGASRWEGELLHRTRDGIQLTVTSRWSLQRDYRGEPVATMETNNDITERKRAYDRLRETEQELRRLLDAIPAMVWSSSPGDGSIDYINARWADFGWTLSDVEGPNWLSIAHPDDLPEVTRKWAESVSTGEPFENVVRFRRSTGEYRWMLVRAAALRGDDGMILRWYGIAGDIDDWRRAEDALHTARTELSHAARIMTLGELTASIAHEVNQPLAAVVTNGEAGLRWLDRSPPNFDAVKNSIEKAVANGRRASDVIARLRALARRSEPEQVVLDLNDMVDEALVLVRREVLGHKANLEIALASPSPRVLGDRVQLQQVIINLAVNALQAMEYMEGPRNLRIRTRCEPGGEGDVAALDVADSGAGIGPEDASRLFSAFFSTKENGMGLGLSICRSIVEAHQGQIGASGNDDGGATFTVRLPAVCGETG